MHDVAHVHEGEAAENVIDQFYQVILRKVDFVLQQRVEVCVDELNDQANTFKIIAPVLCLIDLLFFPLLLCLVRYFRAYYFN